jgi:hypothetical protein
MPPRPVLVIVLPSTLLPEEPPFMRIPEPQTESAPMLVIRLSVTCELVTPEEK